MALLESGARVEVIGSDFQHGSIKLQGFARLSSFKQELGDLFVQSNGMRHERDSGAQLRQFFIFAPHGDKGVAKVCVGARELGIDGGRSAELLCRLEQLSLFAESCA